MINHPKINISVMGGLWEGWDSLGGLTGRRFTKGGYHGL